MFNTVPQRLEAEDDDRNFLIGVAKAVVGNSDVAATTAAALTKQGIDAKRVNILIPWASAAVEIGGYVFKKVEADPETPDNFGLFVRRRDSTKPPFGRPRGSP